MGKTVEVSTETWKKLMTIRTDYELSSMDEVVKKLLAKAHVYSREEEEGR